MERKKDHKKHAPYDSPVPPVKGAVTNDLQRRPAGLFGPGHPAEATMVNPESLEYFQ